MSQSFPNEILSRIVEAGLEDALMHDTPTCQFLTNASLVSRFLRYRSQELLFQNITLYIDGRAGAYKLMETLQGNSRLLRYPRRLNILITSLDNDDRDPVEREFPPECVAFIASFCKVLRSLGSFVLFSSVISHFKVINVDLPRGFIHLLPSVLEISLKAWESNLGDDPNFMQRYLPNANSALGGASGPTSLILHPFPTGGQSWLEVQPAPVYQRVVSLDYVVWQPHLFLDLLPRVSNTLKHLAVRYRGPLNLPKDCREHHRTLTERPVTSRFCSVPRLERLEFHVSCFNREETICPIEIPRLMVDYCTPAFSSARILYIHFDWVASLPDATPVPIMYEATIERFLELREDGFGLLDDTLSEMRYLKSLQGVVLDLAPRFRTYFPGGKAVKIASGLVDRLRDQLHREALECFCKTAERMKLQVVTKRAFKF
ncbi:hypothetical protein BKA70DRAFT_1345509 [Coprinopsis sp. MPI-PUGE-AT-0042]|nr:hypothetical protein BKA70DRAFT_1345509 [Coprinopsis sp. MPI-PUGE-AT-0042]